MPDRNEQVQGPENPAIKFFVVPPEDAAFPARAVLTSAEPRICFNRPSEIGAQGARKVIEFKKRDKMPVLISIFSSHGDGKDEDHVLEIEFQDARGRKKVLKLTCHVVNQDKKDQKGFPIRLDFSQDRTGYFKDEKVREVITQAAQDWAYFLEPLPLDSVPVLTESSRTRRISPTWAKNVLHLSNTMKSLELFPDLKEEPRNSPRPRNGQIITGDARLELAKIETGAVQCCVTSPPYWGLRDYGVVGQIGAEMKLDDYIADLVAIFAEVRRVLADDGTFWLNIGDSYTSGGRTWRDSDKKNRARAMDYRAPTPDGLKPKDLIGVPWRLAFALQADGWYLRADVVWNKKNGLPESVKDRPSRIHEYVFLFSKSERYYYDHEAVKEPAVNGSMRSCRSVWTINTEPFKEAHFATFPREIVGRCLRAGSREGSLVLDPFFGSGTVGDVCQTLNRHFLGIEINPEYVEIAKRRLKWVD